MSVIENCNWKFSPNSNKTALPTDKCALGFFQASAKWRCGFLPAREKEVTDVR